MGNIGVGYELLQQWKSVLGSTPSDMKAVGAFEGTAGLIPATGGDLFLRALFELHRLELDLIS